MAIALESDFRSLKTAPAPEQAERASAPGGNGEAFAKRLRQGPGTEEAKAETNQPEAAATDVSFGGLVIPLHPVESLQDAPPVEAVPMDADVSRAEIGSALIAADIESAGIPARSDRQTAESPPPVATEAVAARPAPALPSDAPAIPQAPAQRASETEPAVKDVDLDTARPPPGLLAAEAPATAPPSAQPASRVVEVVEAAPAIVVAAAALAPAPKLAETSERPVQTGVAAAEVSKAAAMAADSVRPADPAPADTGEPAPDLFADSTVRVTDTSVRAETTATTSTPAATSGLASAQPASAPAATPVAPAPPMTPAQAVITASPAQIVDIVAQSAEDGQSDRIVVQLDPPELGRVSIDFKFDASGLQHVTITSETPEAMRQLRQMHFELVQSLERQGFSGQNMTFQHQQQNAQPSPGAAAMARAAAAEDASLLAAGALLAGDLPTNPRTPSGGRLDIRL